MSSELYSPETGSEDEFDAVNDAQYSLATRTSTDFSTRRRVEALLEERRLKALIEDDWDDD